MSLLIMACILIVILSGRGGKDVEQASKCLL